MLHYNVKYLDTYTHIHTYIHTHIFIYIYSCHHLNSEPQTSGATWLRSHQDFGETFPEWKLYEAARSAYNLFSKRLENWDQVMAEMGECCDYGNAKLVNSTVLQNMVSCTQAILPQLWDGTTDEDLKLLVMETLRLCVTLVLSMEQLFQNYVNHQDYDVTLP